MEQPPGQTVVAVDGRRRPRLGQDGPEPARPRRARRDRELHGRPGRAGRGRRAGARRVRRGVGARGRLPRACSSTPWSRRTSRRCALWQALGFEILTHRARGVRPPRARAGRPAHHVPAVLRRGDVRRAGPAAAHLPGAVPRLIAAVIALQLVGTLAALYLPSLNADIIDNGVAQGDTGYIVRVGGVMLAVTLSCRSPLDRPRCGSARAPRWASAGTPGRRCSTGSARSRPARSPASARRR